MARTLSRGLTAKDYGLYLSEYSVMKLQKKAGTNSVKQYLTEINARLGK